MYYLPAVASTPKRQPLLDVVHCCDALVLLRGLSDGCIDAIITDMPYGTTACTWDTVIDLAAWWVEVKRILKPRGVFLTTAAQPFTSALVMSNPAWFKYMWYWKKSRPTSSFLHAKNTPLRAIEDIPVFSGAAMGHESLLGDSRMNYFPQGLKSISVIRKQNAATRVPEFTGLRPSHKDSFSASWTNYPTTLLQFASVTMGQHPTQKPVALYEYLIKTYTRPGELVLDPFSGSGTTAIAARKTGRHFICGDSSQEYVTMSRKRLRDTDPYLDRQITPELRQRSLFAGVTI
jgi:site-specific DNA-methyltransferase (adenine-specific)